ncbi:hypothetical protein [Thauera humireducens]|uniref:hypothetical protein n=1 Tax=Thauera humireducens TaxID=1134435 RepID=UPI0031203D1A
MKPGVEVITPNPKTSGGALELPRRVGLRAQAARRGNEQTAQTFVTELLGRRAGARLRARGATNFFVQRGIGDVLLAWENEAFLSINELGPEDKFSEIVVPSISILAEPPVTVVDGGEEARHRKGRPGLPRVPVLAGRPRSPRGTTTARSKPSMPTRPTSPASPR